MSTSTRTANFVLALFVLVVIGGSLVLLRCRTAQSCSGFAGGPPSAAELPEPAGPDEIRLAVFNIRNFPYIEANPRYTPSTSLSTNICDLVATLDALDADILGVEEIRDRGSFDQVLNRLKKSHRYDLRFAEGGGPRAQHVGIAWDADRFDLVEFHDLDALITYDGGRSALHLRLAPKDGGPIISVVGLHLKSRPSGYELRREQTEALASALAELPIDEPLLVFGDFNTTGPDNVTGPAGEIAALDGQLSSLELERLTNPLGCSAYWEGPGERDGILQPSVLDLVYARGWGEGATVEPWLHCRRSSCGEIVSRIGGEEDATYHDISDHCPLTIDLKLPGT